MEKTKIVIIEDNPKYQEIMQSIFNIEESYELCGLYGSAESFFPVLKEKKEDIDVILLDIELPKMTGIELIPIIKENLGETKILILSQYDNDNNIFNAMSCGANGYLLKSASISEIFEAIHNVKIGIAAMSPYIASRILEMFKEQTQPRKDYKLTNQEKKVLHEIVAGLSKKMIAEKLFISFHTVDSHIRNIYIKLNVHNQVHLVTKTIREHLI